MEIENCRIDMEVRTKMGRTGKIKEINRFGVVLELPIGEEYCAGFECIEPVSDSCASCEMAPVITDQCKQIAELQKERDQWKALAAGYQRNAAYWHEELMKLQKEALAECKPLRVVGGHFFDEIRPFGPDEFRRLSEIAKCYKQVAPEKLLMSREARRVMYLLELEGPNDYRSIAATFGGDWSKTMDGIVELLDAGKIERVDGKYQIVRA
jgi:hypothetical protein